MPHDAYRYVLCRPVPFPEVLAVLDMAMLAVESLHGKEKTRLDARFASDSGRLTVSVDAGTPVGEALNRVFTGFVKREFGEHAFRIERVDGLERSTTTGSVVGAAA